MNQLPNRHLQLLFYNDLYAKPHKDFYYRGIHGSCRKISGSGRHNIPDQYYGKLLYCNNKYQWLYGGKTKELAAETFRITVDNYLEYGEIYED